MHYILIMDTLKINDIINVILKRQVCYLITENEINQFIARNNYDIRKDNNGRWIDQKCTPDVLSIIADCIIQYIYDANNFIEFTSVDIWHYEYAEQNIRDIFNKPSTSGKHSKNEYDKFFAQPLEMLANANVLNKLKKGNRNYYTVNDVDVLEYISLREKNALSFIIMYCEKVLNDSGIWSYFSDFFNMQTQESYYRLKENYENFIIANTNINGKVEVRRIFTKVLNPLAYSKRKLGTVRGRISKVPINYSELMYNRENFRDMNQEKPKGMSRQEWKNNKRNTNSLKYYKYQSLKAKKFLHKYNLQYRSGKSEMKDKYSIGAATQMHHIFPEHQYPEISMYLENLIALTPTQHLTKAHPLNNTQRLDYDYQELLLLAKASTIEENIADYNIETIYSFDNFVEVLNVGFDADYEIENNNFETTMSIIKDVYFERR